MKCTAIGFTEMKGKSSKTGNDFHMIQLNVLTANGNASSGTFNKLGVGFESISIPVEPAVKTKFAMLTYPCNLDLQLDHQMRGQKLEPIVTGLNGEPVLIDISKQAVSKPQAVA